ncbi:hypothetical protein [Aurantiacibacter rhizosphaerae]|uniref:Uncharacterized protein n=1 Tax=Aurantiacibacter rhizosphaerae TaxID=2691582 RepID=A0A844X977_9SPHN|nr:hypothetical protein [Aurantiacibacter rhizosphaerae]MWV26887.1 hypothetical protein [Aurantiacibacter rhizosphaerae]
MSFAVMLSLPFAPLAVPVPDPVCRVAKRIDDDHGQQPMPASPMKGVQVGRGPRRNAVNLIHFHDVSYSSHRNASFIFDPMLKPMPAPAAQYATRIPLSSFASNLKEKCQCAKSE